MLDELLSLSNRKTCYNFFSFSLSIAGDKSFIQLELTGPENVKEFIEQELDL